MVYTQEVDGANICCWETFHNEFQEKMGFFSGYGRNLDAWNDCMRDMYTNEEHKSLTKFNLKDGDKFVLRVVNSKKWQESSPETYAAFLECTNFCNKEGKHFSLELTDCRITIR